MQARTAERGVRGSPPKILVPGNLVHRSSLASSPSTSYIQTQSSFTVRRDMLALCSYAATHTTGGLDGAMAPTYKRFAPYLPTSLM